MPTTRKPLARAGRHKEAAAEFEKALAGEPNDWKTTDWKIHDSLSKSLLALGQRGRAPEHIRASLSLNPANPEMETNLGNILFEAGRHDEGLRHLDVAIRLDPAYADAYVGRASVSQANGDRPGALRDLARALEVAPPDWPHRAEVEGLVRTDRPPAGGTP
jgi:tetratricopeptide (TPR) repeat protein